MPDPERQYRDLADLNPDAFIIQVEGKVVYCNQSARSMFRESKSARLVGMKAIELVDPAFRDFVMKRRNMVLSTGERAPYTETRHLRLDGNSFPSEMVVGRVTWGGRVGTMNIIHDITRRKEANEALRESERRYRDLFDLAVVGIYRTKPRGRHLEVNPALARMRGCNTSAEFMAHFVDAMHPIYVDPSAREEMSRLMREQGYVIGFESESYRRDGTRFWMSETGRAVRDETGQIIAYEGFIEDITERKHAKQSLERSEALHRQAEVMGKMGYWEWDHQEYKMISCSQQFARIYGMTKNEAIEYFSNWDAEIGVVHPDDKERYKEKLHESEAKLEGMDIEYRIVTRSGDVRHIHLRSEVVVNGQDQIIKSFGLEQDITERKQAEEALEKSEALLAQSANLAKVGHAVWDYNEERYVTVSEGYARVFGYSKDEYLAMFTDLELDFELIHPEDRNRYRDYLDDPDLDFQAPDIEYRIITRDGDIRHVNQRYKYVFDASGVPTGALISIQDITDLKEAEEKLHQAQKMEVVGQLTGGLAHDFNNLLAIIQGNAELIADKSEEKDHRLQTIISASKRGAELTHRLLAFSRKQVLEPRVLDLNQMVEEIADLLRSTLGEQIELAIVSGTNLWKCEVDPSQLETTILNLVINARDAMPNGGRITIEVANARLDDDFAAAQAEVNPGQYVMLGVSDTGCGMAPDVISHAFEPFFTTKDIGKGSGLGLSMIYGFAKQSGGHVTIESECDRGTTVRLYLPRSSSQTESKDEVPLFEDSPALNKTVLVIEDAPEVREVMVALVRGLGYRVLEAADATSVQTILAKGEQIDLLLCDVMLPGINGPEIAETVQQLNPSIKVIFMSGFAVNAGESLSTWDPGTVLLQKPFSKETLSTVLRDALDT